MRTGTVSLMPQRRKEVIDDEVRMDHWRRARILIRARVSAQLMGKRKEGRFLRKPPIFLYRRDI